MSAINLAGCARGEHISGMSIDWRDLHKAGSVVETTTVHGTMRLEPAIDEDNEEVKTLKLTAEDYIVTAALTTWAKKVNTGVFKSERRIRVSYVKFVTKSGRVVECGSKLSTGQFLPIRGPCRTRAHLMIDCLTE